MATDFDPIDAKERANELDRDLDREVGAASYRWTNTESNPNAGACVWKTRFPEEEGGTLPVIAGIDVEKTGPSPTQAIAIAVTTIDADGKVNGVFAATFSPEYKQGDPDTIKWFNEQVPEVLRVWLKVTRGHQRKPQYVAFCEFVDYLKAVNPNIDFVCTNGSTDDGVAKHIAAMVGGHCLHDRPGVPGITPVIDVNQVIMGMTMLLDSKHPQRSRPAYQRLKGMGWQRVSDEETVDRLIVFCGIPRDLAVAHHPLYDALVAALAFASLQTFVKVDNPTHTDSVMIRNIDASVKDMHQLIQKIAQDIRRVQNFSL